MFVGGTEILFCGVRLMCRLEKGAKPRKKKKKNQCEISRLHKLGAIA
jgi:hypothetical protein